MQFYLNVNWKHARGIIGGKQANATITFHTDTGRIELLKPGEE
ncbi:hypothetical protein KSF_080400 [Reticulibacter mediterranei]|uniref:Uncharacterized protein n=1 Tax=Reticulibacter mediterranei TaxID=2778369 RepID=A0A8J3IW96_9CHLR|nr:hypothetical protein [Reticulibacter mediterranei]GHO97992.1 hypothetical protein KSF_080400 [Reticulibacter mediterranei]